MLRLGHRRPAPFECTCQPHARRLPCPSPRRSPQLRVPPPLNRMPGWSRARPHARGRTQEARPAGAAVDVVGVGALPGQEAATSSRAQAHRDHRLTRPQPQERCGWRRASPPRRPLGDRQDDVVIAGAAAQIAFEVFTDLALGRLWFGPLPSRVRLLPCPGAEPALQCVNRSRKRFLLSDAGSPVATSSSWSST